MLRRFLNLAVTSLLGAFALFSIVWLSSSSNSLNSKQEKERRARKEKWELITELNQFNDSSRNRDIPYVLYHQKVADTTKPIRLVVFSHGYGHNYQKNYLGYTYITKYLARKGFWVISIQHELPNDEPLTFGENIYEIRYPIWKRGMESIRATLEHFKQQHPGVSIVSTDLLGHSNGGDMSVLTATKYPSEFRKIVTLDNLRCPFPLQKYPEMLTLRSIDKTADLNVIPTKAEQKEYDIKVVQLKKIKHNDMTDYALKFQQKQIIKHIWRFLR